MTEKEEISIIEELRSVGIKIAPDFTSLETNIIEYVLDNAQTMTSRSTLRKIIDGYREDKIRHMLTVLRHSKSELKSIRHVVSRHKDLDNLHLMINLIICRKNEDIRMLEEMLNEILSDKNKAEREAKQNASRSSRLFTMTGGD